MSERSRALYRALVYEDPDFPRFFEQVTPISELTALNIGSRPSKRSSGGVEALRAIPWVFAWTQNRVLLPSWYGAGAALCEGALELQREMAAELAVLPEPAVDARDGAVQDRPRAWRSATCGSSSPALRDRFWPRIEGEYAKVVGRLLEVLGADQLLDGAPALQRRLSHRNPWVDPLSHLQVELLARARAGRADAQEPLLATISGIAAGLRNTG